MQTFDPGQFATLVALVGLVILAASLASGALERLGIPQVAVFIGLGALLGSAGLGLLEFTIVSPTLATIATLSLVLVLFLDSLSIRIAELRRHATTALVVLGPGTLIAAALTTAAGWWLLELPGPAAAILGAALASTDPVMTRALLRIPEVPASTRLVLGLESGLNDLVVLPIVLIAIAFQVDGGADPAVAGTLGSILIAGPAIGLGVGLVAVKSMVAIRARLGIRRDYESLYVLGIAFTAFAAAEAVHASGFMAAFAAGLAVAGLDVELCDCFHDYGEATTEMLLLLGFVALGAGPIWSGLGRLDLATLAVAAVALFGRSAVLALALPAGGADPVARRLIIWFGPRGLSSLLLVLLAVFAGVPGAEELFAITALVALLSLAGHGAVLTWVTHRLRRRDEAPDLGVPLAGAALVHHPELITIDELEALDEARIAYRLLDVRSERGYDLADTQAAGAIRIEPNAPVESAARHALPRSDWLVAYCA